MLKKGLLNPGLLSLLARIRHTNTVVIADRGFPYWPQIETVDLSLIDDVPTVLQVYAALQENFSVGRIFSTKEFRQHNPKTKLAELKQQVGAIPLIFESHANFKKRVPNCIGLIRTGDTTPYANLILESA